MSRLELGHPMQIDEELERSSIRNLLPDAIDLINERRAEDAIQSGRHLSSGLRDLDYALGGLRRGCLYVVGGRPKMGATSLTTRFVLSASQAGLHCSVFACGASAIMESIRLVRTLAEVDPHWFDRTPLPRPVEDAIRSAANKLAEAPINIFDSAFSRTDIYERLRATLTKHRKLDLLVIQDFYESNFPFALKPHDESDTVTGAWLKSIARELDIPVVIETRVKESAEKRPYRRPYLADLMNPRGIVGDADVVVALYRDEYYVPNSPDAGILEIRVLRNRYGSDQTILVSTRSGGYLSDLESVPDAPVPPREAVRAGSHAPPHDRTNT